jgi:shikimate dehydrogenase
MSVDRYAVFGSPINHSKSPRIHALFAKQKPEQELIYTSQEVRPENFQQAVVEFFEQGGKGLNCTVPLKELAWTLCLEQMSLESKIDTTQKRYVQIGRAVNTLKLENDGSIGGYNTDGCGLITDLMSNHQITLANKHLLILGAGGATRGILGPLLEQKTQSIVIANRTVERAEGLAEEFQPFGPVTGCSFADLHGQQFDLILNATSASLTGQLPPLPDSLLAKDGVCYDLAYGNEPTPFVKWGERQGAAKSLDGLGMLVEQAAEAFFIWRDVRPDTQPVIDLLNSER